MDRLIPVREPPLKGYYLATSIEEALGYLAAHSGEAQVIGGGTTLMPLVQRGLSLARHLVDVSRLGPMRRIRVEDNHLVLGGAVTLAQVLRTDTVQQQHLALRDMAQYACTPRLQGLATLAGSIVNAYGYSSVTTGLVALHAEAEIANLTGSQWLPVRALLVRPGTCRVNSMFEVVTSIRVRLMQAGEGAALVRLGETTPGNERGGEQGPSVYAVSLGLNPATGLVTSLCLVIGTSSATPRLCGLSELAGGDSPDTGTLRRAVGEWAAAQVAEGAGSGLAGAPEAAQGAFDRALARARAGLATTP